MCSPKEGIEYMNNAPYLIQNIINCYKDQLLAKPMPLKHIKAVEAISSCRTTECGVSVYECDDKLTETHIPHSCRHRSCWLCASRRRYQWVEEQQQRLLDCPHFHCVFTLPHEYHGLWQYNQRWFVDTFFDVVRSTLMDLLKDKAEHGLVPGILMAMHTWGRQLALHPHIHCVVTGGGMNKSGQWVSTGKYLLPARQLRALYRGRFQDRIKMAYAAGELTLPPDQSGRDFLVLYKSTYKKTWCVQIEEQYAHGRGVLKYLSRYLRGGPINPNQIVRCDSQQIGFRYKDHRAKKTKILNLKPGEFIRRLLQHVPESRQHMVRHYGVYAGAAKVRRNTCREQLGGLMESLNESVQVEKEELYCSCCGSIMRLVWRIYPKRKKANSYKVESRQWQVQQQDEPVIGWGKKKITALRL